MSSHAEMHTKELSVHFIRLHSDDVTLPIKLCCELFGIFVRRNAILPFGTAPHQEYYKLFNKVDGFA